MFDMDVTDTRQCRQSAMNVDRDPVRWRFDTGRSNAIGTVVTT